MISYAMSPVNYVLGVEEQPKDGGAAARRFVSKFEAEVSSTTMFFVFCSFADTRPYT